MVLNAASGQPGEAPDDQEFYAQVNQPIKEVQLSAQSVEPRVIEKAGLMDKMRGRGDLVEATRAWPTVSQRQCSRPMPRSSRRPSKAIYRPVEPLKWLGQPKPLPATKNGWNRPCRAIRSGLKC